MGICNLILLFTEFIGPALLAGNRLLGYPGEVYSPGQELEASLVECRRWVASKAVAQR